MYWKFSLCSWTTIQYSVHINRHKGWFVNRQVAKGFLFGQQPTVPMPCFIYSKKLSPSWEDNRFSAGQAIHCIFMETEGSLPCLKVPATCPHTEPEQSTPCSPIPLPEDPPMTSVFLFSVSHYLSAICSICSQLYHDFRSKYANFTTHDNTQFWWILSLVQPEVEKGIYEQEYRESLYLHTNFNINLWIIFIHSWKMLWRAFTI